MATKTKKDPTHLTKADVARITRDVKRAHSVLVPLSDRIKTALQPMIHYLFAVHPWDGDTDGAPLDSEQAYILAAYQALTDWANKYQPKALTPGDVEDLQSAQAILEAEAGDNAALNEALVYVRAVVFKVADD